ncbi:MAG: bifunctional 5,10-methylene-tetrahydrofolate dehydrogenase/5,10-methylene-tetrahydrofolate cyclohydrolase [Nitrososphaeraceae archaeon]|nr:bifunctional 5,10-methylene-tetrahydrofolate dehydrogenase/5,10-methylene-tetrahydrofolate cyclohydrolase [Nitrososphaeraceae archaeon]
MILNGIEVSAHIRSELKKEVSNLDSAGTRPLLATVLVGNDPASITYISNKHKACNEIGILTRDHKLDGNISQSDLINLVESLNDDSMVHGILIQLPLPRHIDEYTVINKISPRKDVDGLTVYNQGLLFAGRGELVPCTPKGIIEILRFYNIDVSGKDVVIVNRSNLVGKPLFLLFLGLDSTVTVCHSKTKNLVEKIKNADILVTAIGNRNVFTLTEDMIKKDTIVIDVGISRHMGKVIGDVDFESVSKKSSWITPVPGGVGPMTICMLLKNTLIATRLQLK